MLNELLAQLNDLNVRLYVESGHLKCKAPPDVLTEDIKFQIKFNKEALIEALSQSGRPFFAEIPKASRSEPLPLSYAQQRLWFLDQWEPGSSFYNIPLAFGLSGRLNKAALIQSFHEIARRHEVLRSFFVMEDGLAVQKAWPSLYQGFSHVALSGEAAPCCKALCLEEAQKPFDLAKGPLIRLKLIEWPEYDRPGRGEFICPGRSKQPLHIRELDHKAYRLLITMHHIVSDGWSAEILAREFAAVYQAFCSGSPSPFAELSIQYADYACWQRSWLVGDNLQRQIDYWKNKLQGAPALLELPTDKPRPSIMTYQGALHRFDIPNALQVRALSHQQGATLFALLLAVFKVLLFRHSGQGDICIGTPVANRTRIETEGLIGFFANTLVLRSDLSANPAFDEFLAKIKQLVWEAQSHQDLPFEKLVEAIQPERDMSRNPLFQVMFVLQGIEMNSVKLPEIEMNLLEPEHSSSKFDLSLHIQDHSDGGLSGIFEYNTDLFDPPSIERLAKHYSSLLQGVLDKPRARLFDLPLLTDLEKEQCLIAWNATQRDRPKQQSLQQLFEEQVEKTPDARAAVFEYHALSYRELNSKANRLAHFLIEKGVGPDVIVGLCVERSLDMLIGLLGILKTGGAYLPLDPDYPAERIAYMLQNSRVSWLLTQKRLIDVLPQNSAQMLLLDGDETPFEAKPSENPLIRNHPLHLAYIIYTSGSTGNPKGVMVSHRNAVHSTLARFAYYAEPVKAYMLLSSFAFDSSVAGLFWTLGQGGCLCLPCDESCKDPDLLAALIERYQVSHLLALPSYYALLLKQAGHRLSSLKAAIVAGEACLSEIVKQHRATLAHADLYNEYGPTEGSVWSSVYQAGLADLDRPLSIGRPIVNVRIYILDQAFNPVPIGVLGELHIGGEGLVRGYLERPELTAEKFIPNPFQTSGARLYKTGDLARYRADGAIEFLGRIDHQVKIRGFRIELGEIEARLLAYPGVKQALVSVRALPHPGPLPAGEGDSMNSLCDFHSHEKRLAAYWTETQPGMVKVEALKTYLKQSLPDYMIPGIFMRLEAMPLSANGKLDRKKLPVPDQAKSLGPGYVAPNSETEKVLAGIWADLLGLARVGIEDDFFDLGGHSLLVTQLAFAIQKSFEFKWPVKLFFENKTIRAQASLIDKGCIEEAFIDLEAEARLGDSILPFLDAKAAEAADARALFLTGATGFLGLFLLADLLEQTRANIYCLIRAPSEAEASTRLNRQIARYELAGRIDLSRVIPVCGDLSSDRLGLSDNRYHEIAIHADAIYHNGAQVNFIQPYQALKAANVSGTLEVLKLAALCKAKAVHYVSTLSVFSGESQFERGFSEKDEPRLDSRLDGGYAQSKWVAEKIIRRASERGFQAFIYRPATVAGDSLNGAWNTDDFLCRMLKGCIQLGYVPESKERIDMAPVDYISRSIVALSLNPSQTVFHLNHPSPAHAGDLIEWLASGFGIKRVSYRDWLDRLEAKAQSIQDFALAPLLSLFSEREDFEADEPPVQYDCSETQKILASMGIGCPPIDESLLKKYSDYLNRSGFVSKIFSSAG